MKRVLALVLCAALLLSGCSGLKSALESFLMVKFEDMQYVRPDMDEVAQVAQAAIDAAQSSESAEALMEKVWAYYEIYNDYLTNSNLAYIHYHADLQDIYWQKEEEFCSEKGPQLDMYLEDIYRAMAESPFCEELEEEYYEDGWFDEYRGESRYDEVLVEMMEREQALIGDYCDLTAQGQSMEEAEFYDACALPMAQVLADLAAVRQELAQYAGYDSYTNFAWDYYYYRDYTPAQAETYLEDIRQELVPVYEQLSGTDLLFAGSEDCAEEAVFDYVQTAAQALGGEAWEAFQLMEDAGLYDIRTSESKSGMSFELYLPNYYEPYVFISGTGTRYDCLTFAHEFGHFATDYAADGSVAGIDVMEVFSQGMELLSLPYADADGGLTDLKLADCLCTYVEQAAYAAFEQALYRLPAEELTAQGVLDLYKEICTAYGFAATTWDPRDMVTVPHFFTNPLYIISYVVSNDAAIQLYQLELAESGAGRDVFLESLDTEESWFLAFLEEAGLESPFGRVDEVGQLMEERFLKNS